MRLRTVGLVLALVVLISSLSAEAQQAGRIPRIGILGPGTAAAAESVLRVLRVGLHELGYVEGQTIHLELRGAETPELLTQRATELVNLNPDLIVAGGTAATLAAKQATGSIPIIMVGAGDPVGQGLVTSLARPGGNVTGTAVLTVELSRKQLELLKEVLPHVTRVAVLWNAGSPAIPRQLSEVERAANVIGVSVEKYGVRVSTEFDRVFNDITKARADAVLVFPDPWMLLQLTVVADLATEAPASNLPIP